jgi:asparagine synthetase B (glutamine-hydrolysing)
MAQWSAVMSRRRQDGRRSVLTGVLADEVVAISPIIALRSFLADHEPLEFSSWPCRTETSERKSVGSVSHGQRRRLLSLGDHTGEWRQRSRGHSSLGGAEEGTRRRIPSANQRRGDGPSRRSPRCDKWTLNRNDGPGSLRHRLFDGEYPIAALERYDRSGAAHSIECRSPFMDRRVVEFFQRLPARQLVAGGWTKSVLRRA